MRALGRLPIPYASNLDAALERAAVVAESKSYRDFVEIVRAKSPWRFKGVKGVDRYLRGVEHHLLNFVPKLLTCIDGDTHTVIDFGCGSGSGSIALAMIFPKILCHGTDISPREVSIAHERAKLYGVSDRCRFDYIGEGEALPFSSNHFDLCICCSVMEYVTDPNMRKSCVQEMARVVAPGGVLFMTVPNRLYPFEIHSRKLGWNYFPNLLRADMVGSHAWEVKRLARPHVLKLRRTPWLQLLTPWTNFGLEKKA